MKTKSLRLFLLFSLFLPLLTDCSKNTDNSVTVTIPGSWVQTNGPGNGLTSCVAGFGNILLAGVAGRGMFYSGDGGVSWVCDTSAVLNSSSPVAMTVNGDTVFTASDKLYRSLNRGVVWKAISNISQKTISLAVSSHLVVTGETDSQGVSISPDLGVNWSNYKPGSSTSRYVVTLLGQDVFAGSAGSGVFYSHDLGQHWNVVNNGLGSLDVLCIVSGKGQIYAGTSKGLYISADKGLHWALLNNGLPTGMAVGSIAVSGTALLIGNGSGVWYSSDNGASWTRTAKLPDPNLVSLSFSGTSLMAGTSSGLFISSDNGLTWALKGVPVTQVSSMCSGNSGVFAAATWNSSAAYVGSAHGASWSITKPQLYAGNVFSLAFDNGNLIAGTDTGVFVSRDNGQSWNRRSDGLTNLSVQSVGLSGSYWYAGTMGGGFWRSADAGLNWVKANTGLDDSKYIVTVFCSGSMVFAGTYYGGLLISSDNGQSWTKNSSMPSTTIITGIVSKSTSLFAGTYNGVYRSDDNGQTWAASTLTNKAIYSIFVYGNLIFAGVRDDGVYYSANNGQAWLLLHTGFPYQISVTSMATDGTYLFAGSSRLGVWTHPLK